MAETANNPLPVADEDPLQKETLWERFMDWVRTELVWYAGSFSFHLLGLSLLLLLPNFGGSEDQDDAAVLVSQAEEEVEKKERDRFDHRARRPRSNPADPDLVIDPTLPPPATAAERRTDYEKSKVFEPEGGGTRNGIEGHWRRRRRGVGVRPRSQAGAAQRASALGLGTGNNPGSGGDGTASAGSAAAAQVMPGPASASYRTCRERRPGVAGQPPVLRGQLEPATLRGPLHRQDLHRHGRRSWPMPARRRWASCPSSPPGKRTSRQALTRNISARASPGSSATSSPTATWPRARRR